MGSQETSACSWPGAHPSSGAAPRESSVRPAYREVPRSLGGRAVGTPSDRFTVKNDPSPSSLSVITLPPRRWRADATRTRPAPGRQRPRHAPLDHSARQLHYLWAHRVMSPTCRARPTLCRRLPAALRPRSHRARIAGARALAGRPFLSETRERQPGISHHHWAPCCSTCLGCEPRFSVTADTPMHKTRLTLMTSLSSPICRQRRSTASRRSARRSSLLCDSVPLDI